MILTSVDRDQAAQNMQLDFDLQHLQKAPYVLCKHLETAIKCDIKTNNLSFLKGK